MPDEITKPDLITIGLYSLQTPDGFNKAIFGQMENIKNIKFKFAEAAARMEPPKLPPQIRVSFILIPAWPKYCVEEDYYAEPPYLEAKEAFKKELTDKLAEIDVTDVYDFYDKASNQERLYLQNLSRRGSCADMVKMHAIIHSKGHHHLQLDTNTLINDYRGLYNETFGAMEHRLGIALNASFYGEFYVSAHNKIVYTSPNDEEFIIELERVHLQYCEENASAKVEDKAKDREEKKDKNSIYSKDFVVALSKLGAVTSIKLETGKTIYPAQLRNEDCYRLTKYIITSVNLSWDDKRVKPQNETDIESLRIVIKIGDADCDYASFKNAAKKHTDSLKLHKYGENPELYYQHHYITHATSEAQKIQKRQKKEDQAAYDKLISLSNKTLEINLISLFFKEVGKRLLDNNSAFALEKGHGLDYRLQLLQEIARNFLKTERGKTLCDDLFGCEIEELYEHPEHYVFINHSEDEEHNHGEEEHNKETTRGFREGMRQNRGTAASESNDASKNLSQGLD